jgi:hypothetical protein
MYPLENARLMDVRSNHEMVQDGLDARNAARQGTNILGRVTLEHPLEANSVGNSANDERGDLKPWLGAQPAVHGLLESVRRVDAPKRTRVPGRFDKSA